MVNKIYFQDINSALELDPNEKIITMKNLTDFGVGIFIGEDELSWMYPVRQISFDNQYVVVELRTAGINVTKDIMVHAPMIDEIILGEDFVSLRRGE